MLARANDLAVRRRSSHQLAGVPLVTQPQEEGSGGDGGAEMGRTLGDGANVTAGAAAGTAPDVFRVLSKMITQRPEGSGGASDVGLTLENAVMAESTGNLVRRPEVDTGTSAVPVGESDAEHELRVKEEKLAQVLDSEGEHIRTRPGDSNHELWYSGSGTLLARAPEHVDVSRARHIKFALSDWVIEVCAGAFGLGDRGVCWCISRWGGYANRFKKVRVGFTCTGVCCFEYG